MNAEPVVDDQLRGLLVGLHKLGARVTGSIARGQFREGWSDIDIYVPYGKWEQAKRLMCALPVKWESSFIGHLATRQTSTLIEVSFLFDKQDKDGLLETVELAGKQFKTY